MTWTFDSKETGTDIPKWEIDIKLVLQDIRESVMRKRIIALKKAQLKGKSDPKITGTETIIWGESSA